MRPIILLSALALGMSIACAADAQAQSPQPAPNTDASPGGLSDKLDRSGGVIHPQGDVDPNIAKPARVPDPRSMTVIPPPGSNGAPGPKAK